MMKIDVNNSEVFIIPLELILVGVYPIQTFVVIR